MDFPTHCKTRCLSFRKNSFLRGIECLHSNVVRQKLPVTPNILHKLQGQLDLTNSLDMTFWATCVIAFFSFFRKSNLLIQYRNCTLLVPVPKIDHSKLFPHWAIVHACKLLAAHDSAKVRNGPAFVLHIWDQVKPLTYSTLLPNSKSCLINAGLTAPSTLATLFVTEEPPLRWTVESLSTILNFKEIGFLAHMNDIFILPYSIRL